MAILPEYSLVKKPHQRIKYQHEEIVDIANCADPTAGPRHFLKNFYYIQHPTRGKILYQPYDYQIRYIDVCHQNRFSIALLPRQSGKSTTAAGYLLWYAMFVPDSTILIAAHKYQGAQEIMQRIRFAYEACPDHIRAGVTSYNKGSIEFENGSRIVAQTTTENTGRGMSISLLYLDEFAFVRNTIAKDFWTSIVPTLSTGGKAIITSTPNSDEDQFWEIWKAANKCVDDYGNATDLGRNGFKAFKATWDEHPDRDEKWANEQRAQLGDERFSREIECNPIIFDETLISAIVLADLEFKEPVFKQGQIRWYKKPEKNKVYTISLDPSLGTGGDPAAIQVFELPNLIQVAEWRHNKTNIQMQIRLLKEIAEYIFDITNDENSIFYSVENNTLGEAALLAINELGEENIRGSFLSEPKQSGSGRAYRKGFNTTHKSKLLACSKLKNFIEKQKMIVNSQSLISELKTFIASGGSFAAKAGETDDLVMATLLNIRMVHFLQSYDAELDSKLKEQEEFVAPMPFIMITG
jgi:hypothetical protein